MTTESEMMAYMRKADPLAAYTREVATLHTEGMVTAVEQATLLLAYEESMAANLKQEQTKDEKARNSNRGCGFQMRSRGVQSDTNMGLNFENHIFFGPCTQFIRNTFRWISARLCWPCKPLNFESHNCLNLLISALFFGQAPIKSRFRGFWLWEHNFT